jgi:hypothetical protein
MPYKAKNHLLNEICGKIFLLQFCNLKQVYKRRNK